MNNLSVIDHFLQTYSHYIDSGFGLLAGDVAFLSEILIGIDITLAGLMWAFSEEPSVLPKLIKKVLYVGAFAYIINNFQRLAEIVFSSFSGLGLKASAGTLSPADLLRPGAIAEAGYSAAHPLLEQVSRMVGFPELFLNALPIFVLLLAWLLVLFAFFLLAIQLLITIIEFKLTALCGFVLVPFALWSKTTFLAERVLGHVISSGIKMLVLAVIIGIGSTLFSSFSQTTAGQDITLAIAMSEVLGALTLLGLGIFGPSIAAGLISGAPQLGAGAVLATSGAAAGMAAVTALTAQGAARMGSSAALTAVRSGTALTSGAAFAYNFAQATSQPSGASGLAAGLATGLGGVAKAAGGAMAQGAKDLSEKAAAPFREAAQAGRTAAWSATGGAAPESASESPSNPAAPASPQSHSKGQTVHASAHAIHQAVRSGDQAGQGASPSLNTKDE